MADITGNIPQVYRITYETYSKFANKINRCTSLPEVSTASKRYLKYLLNFHCLILSVEQEDSYLIFKYHQNEVIFDNSLEKKLLLHEKNILKNEIPIKTNLLPDELFEELNAEKLKNPELWAWVFNKNEKRTIVTLIADENKKFATGDVEILKLIVDSLEAKFKEIYLKEELDHKNKSLLQALDVIKHQNIKISKIVDNQKQVIEKRTREIVQKNEKLLQISAMNAHNLREPLTRVQGIVQLFEVFDDKTCREDLVPKLISSAKEMDQVLKEVIEMASKELTELKANET